MNSREKPSQIITSISKWVENIKSQLFSKIVYDSWQREKKGTEYSEKYQKEEENKLLFQTLNAQSACIKFESDDDEAEEVAVEQQELPQLTVFDRYNFNLIPKDLPILHKRAEILKAIHEHSVVVVTATTGSGKTTQVPQYILEEAAKKKENCNIIVTQPRRMAGKLLKCFDFNYVTFLVL